MILRVRQLSRRLAAAMLSSMFAASAALWSTGAVQADIVTPVYSFESDLEGFGPNGAGTTVSLDSIGATDGSGSMKVTVHPLATFVGAQNAMLHPAIGNPPGLDHVLFDLTITEEFAGAFAVVGVMMFGVTQEGLDRQVQTGPSDDPTLEFHIGGLEPGTYTDVFIDMTQFFHPETFDPATFNDIFGTEGSGPFDIIPTSFQLYFNKSNDAPLTVYIDNIRVGTTTEGLPGDYNDDGVVDAADYTVWRNHLGDDTEDAINNNGDRIGGIDTDDYLWWKQHYGTGGVGTGGLASLAVPEPTGPTLLFTAVICGWTARRGRRALQTSNSVGARRDARRFVA